MKKITSFLTAAFAFALLSSTVLAATVNVQGGSWSFGGHHDPGDWGAYSRYYHPSKWHWSSVVRRSDFKSSYDSAGAGDASRAFINTSVGEHADFDFGFNR